MYEAVARIHMPLLTELNHIFLRRFYKHDAPNGAWVLKTLKAWQSNPWARLRQGGWRQVVDSGPVRPLPVAVLMGTPANH